MQEVYTTPGKTYSVHTVNGCTVSDDSGWSKEIEAPDGYFTAHGSSVQLSDDEATLREVFKAAPIGGSGAGGGGGSTSGGAAATVATGEKVQSLQSGTLTIRHATWFDNAEQTTISIIPATWQNEVMTCYLKTAVPVTLSGVSWLYGEPTMAEGYTYVIALQQIDAATVFANLAYVFRNDVLQEIA